MRAIDAAESPGNGQTEGLFERYESVVRSYCRSFPAVFARAKGSFVYDRDGRSWLDFFTGAGTLSYGHNPEPVKAALMRYLESDGILHALDMYTAAKAGFIERFVSSVLAPRGLDYKLQFCGPTGANAVEAVLKLARRVTGRRGVIAFTGSYHGMSLGALAVSSGREARAAAGAGMGDVTFVPYPCGWGKPVDSIDLLERVLADPMSGVEPPAAIVLETMQMEGGVQVAPAPWLAEVRRLCDQYGAMMIVDDIQAGCGRTGTFFSFERAGIEPDMVVLSKAIGGCGMPMALALMRRGHDQWNPAEHTGTFRGNQLAFIAGEAALGYWDDPAFTGALVEKSAMVGAAVRELGALHGLEIRGLGMAWGLDFTAAGGGAVAQRAQRAAFERGLLVERCGREDTVVKLLPPLTATAAELERGLELLGEALETAFAAPVLRSAQG